MGRLSSSMTEAMDRQWATVGGINAPTQRLGYRGHRGQAAIAAILLSIATVLFLVPVEAQQAETDEGLPVGFLSATDPEGDVSGADSGEVAAGIADYVDVLALNVAEATTTLDVTLGFADTWTNGDPPYPPEMSVGFSSGGAEYQVVSSPQGGPCGPGSQVPVWLQRGEGDEAECIEDLRTATSWDGTEVTFQITKDLVTDERGNPVRPGSTLEDFWVSAAGRAVHPVLEPTPEWTDRLPDSGRLHGLRLEPDLHNLGDLRLSSERPVQSSNGGAMAFLYAVELANHGTADLVAGLMTEQVPGDWDVAWPDVVHVEAGSNRTLPIVVQVPSRHVHDGQEGFRLVASAGEHRASLELAVRYGAVPQPAGHHPLLTMHSAAESQDGVTSPGVSAWMNTLGEGMDPASDGVPIPLEKSVQGGPFEVTVPLSPLLDIGLDFEGGDHVRADLFVSAPVEIPSVHVVAQLRGQCNEGRCETRILAEAIPGPITLGAARTPLSIGLALSEDLDRVKPGTFDNLALYLRLRPEYLVGGEGYEEIPGHKGPVLHAEESTLRLPLIEYHDIEDVWTSGGMAVSSSADTSRLANPGSILTWPITVRGEGGQAVIQVLGVGAEWVRLEHQEMPLLDGEGTVDVVLEVPDDAEPGRLVDLVFTAWDPEEPWRAAALRLSAILRDTADVQVSDDIQAPADPTADTPVPGLVAVMLVIACLVARRR